MTTVTLSGKRKDLLQQADDVVEAEANADRNLPRKRVMIISHQNQICHPQQRFHIALGQDLGGPIEETILSMVTIARKGVEMVVVKALAGLKTARMMLFPTKTSARFANLLYTSIMHRMIKR